MLRCVFDTNIWVSALATPGGNCEKLYRAVDRREAECLTSLFLLKELERVLSDKLGVPDRTVRERIAHIVTITSIVETRSVLTVVRGHDADNRVLECAVDGRADFLVTGDRSHLLGLEAFQSVRIVTPKMMTVILGV